MDLISQVSTRELTGPARGELLSLSQESDPELLASGLLTLGRRALDRRDWETAALIFRSLSEAPVDPRVPEAARVRARREWQALRGSGDFGSRFEFSSRHLLSEVSNPVVLASMTGAQAIFTFSRFGLWSRLIASPTGNLATRGLGAEMLSGLGAFAIEAPAFVGLHRGLNAVAGIRPSGGTASLGDHLRGSYLQLGALRLFGWAGRRAFSGLHGVNALGRATRWEAFSALSSRLFPQAAMFGGIYLAQRLEAPSGHSPFADAFLTYLQFNLSSVLAARLLGPNWASMMQRLHVPASQIRNPFRLSPELATPEGLRMPLPEDTMREARALNTFMVEGPGSGSRPKPPRARSNSPFLSEGDSLALRAQLEHLIERALPEYFENLRLLPSEVFPFRFRDRGRIDRQIQEYLNEADLARFPPNDPLVEALKTQIWSRQPRGDGAPYPLLERTLAGIQEAHARLSQWKSPDGSRFQPSRLIPASNLSRLLGREIFFFDDTRRVTGSFKERGALVEALRARDQGALHLVTASHGNHGLAIALAAQKLGLRSTIVVPHTTPRVKVEALENLGAVVVTTSAQPWRGYEESRDWGLRYTFERNFLLESALDLRDTVRYVHGFEDVIPGQGIAGLEIAEQIRSLPADEASRFGRAGFLVPMGGGGLAAGVATAVKHHLPEARVIGVASDQAPALHVSLLHGTRSEIFVNERGLADSGIGLSIPGRRPFEILRETLDASLAVTDPHIGEAMRLIHRHEGLTVEGAAATGLAALLDPRSSALNLPPHGPLVLYLTGRNIDGSRHQAVMEGREASLPEGWPPSTSKK